MKHDNDMTLSGPHEKDLHRTQVSHVYSKRPLLVWRRDWRLFISNPVGLLGLGLIVIFALMGLTHSILLSTVWDRTTYHPMVGFDYDNTPHPNQPSWKHPLGTDSMGRDVLSQLLYSSRTSFGVGLTAGIVATALAAAVGVLSVYYGGKVDILLMVVADSFVLMPPQVVLLVVGLLIDMDWLWVGLVYGVFAGLGTLALIAKSHALSIRVKPYIQAARVAGGGDWHIIRTHFLPNMLSLIIMNMMFTVTGSVLIEALLSFFGRTRIRMSWGTMIWFTQSIFRLSPFGEQWHVILPPAFAIMLFCGAFYMVGRALDSVVNPRLAHR